MGLSWAGTVAMIDLRLLTRREGGRGGRGRGTAGWYCAERMRVGRWRFRREGVVHRGGCGKVGRVSAGLVTLSGGIGAVRRRRGGVGR